MRIETSKPRFPIFGAAAYVLVLVAVAGVFVPSILQLAA